MKSRILSPQEPTYTRVPEEESGTIKQQQHNRSPLPKHCLVIILVLVAILTACLCARWTLSPSQSQIPRREWRTLTTPEKHEYLTAVSCLQTKTSRLGLNHTLYHDFPYVHSRVGQYVHDAAPFLAWHRYYIHIYESALKHEWNYTGTMPFWNWQLDWKDITKSPIWSTDHGFGTTGDPERSLDTILNGHCVVDGLFADIVIPYLDEKFYPHCLSRGFAQGEELRNLSMMLSPETIEDLLDLDEYDAFNLGMEHGPHLAIPRSIRGDFSLLTAPSDPVFFLHHAQLDRLWWKWQLLHPQKRWEYSGLAKHGLRESASVEDLLLVERIAGDVKVEEVLDTHGALFCYRY
ncbi:Di-copper centre-containing protein [Byssothecium circinans]|uniref:Di-copper centre-containing protein n=1 Tax=Byssothecium circinans TaxID=147558 RepID=A0A6A5TLY8_9PLEO|nr:Di-copper centre-containing protein [Byssothecium circinans]